METPTAIPETEIVDEEKAEYLDVNTMPFNMFDEDKIQRYSKHNWEF